MSNTPQPTAHIRLLNASPDTPAVDISVNDALITRGLAYKSFTEYMPAAPGAYTIRVMPEGLNSVLATLETIDLMDGGIYTLAVTGTETDLSIELIHDMPRPKPNGRAYLRFINLSPYDTEFDAFINESPVLTALGYTEISDYLPVRPGSHKLKLFNSRDNRLVLTDPRLTLRAGNYYAVYIVGRERGDAPLQVLIPLEGASYL